MSDSMKPFILIVEDEKRIAQIEMAFLEHAGYATLHVETGPAALHAVSRYSPDLIVLDRMLPGKDGLTVCRELRTLTQVPVIMVTALREEQDRIDGFRAGVDDYLCKPFNPAELVERVKAVLRRSNTKDTTNPNSFLVMDTERMSALVAGQRLDLTRSEYRILALLVQRSGKVVERKAIMEQCFEDKATEMYDRTIDNHIKNIRKKIAAIAPNQEVIHSIYGVGYKYERLGG